MKKSILLPLLAILTFYSCTKENDPTPNNDTTTAKSKYHNDTIKVLLGSQWNQDKLFTDRNKQYYNIYTISKDSTQLIENYYFEQDSMVISSGFPFTKENKVSQEVKYVIDLFEGSIGKLEYYSPDTIKTSYSSTFNGVTNSGTNTYLKIK